MHGQFKFADHHKKLKKLNRRLLDITSPYTVLSALKMVYLKHVENILYILSRLNINLKSRKGKFVCDTVTYFDHLARPGMIKSWNFCCKFVDGSVVSVLHVQGAHFGYLEYFLHPGTKNVPQGYKNTVLNSCRIEVKEAEVAPNSQQYFIKCSHF